MISPEIDGQSVARWMLIHGPNEFQEGSRDPVLFGFYGKGGEVGLWTGRLGLLLDEEGFIRISPEGFLKPWNLNREISPTADRAFVDMIVEHLITSKSANVERRAAMGNSNSAGTSNDGAVYRGHCRCLGVAGSVTVVETSPSERSWGGYPRSRYQGQKRPLQVGLGVDGTGISRCGRNGENPGRASRLKECSYPERNRAGQAVVDLK